MARVGRSFRWVKPCSGVGGSAPTSPCGIAIAPSVSRSLVQSGSKNEKPKSWTAHTSTWFLHCPKTSLPSLTRTRIWSTASCSELRPRPCLPSRPIPNIGRRDRLLRRASHLGTEPAFSSPLALCGPGRRNLARWYPLGSLPPGFLLASTRAIAFVPPFVLDLSARGLRR